MFDSRTASTKITIALLIAVLAVVLWPLSAAAQDNGAPPKPDSQPAITYAPDPNAAKNMTLLLKDFDPQPMLHTAVHRVPRAKYPAVDIHNHVNDAAGIGEKIAPAEVVRRMDEANIRKIVILTGMWGEKLQSVLDKMVKPYPDRFIVFAQFDWSKINEANFSAEMVTQLDDAVRRGARGLKVLKDLGLQSSLPLTATTSATKS
jgi:hypothetical protein